MKKIRASNVTSTIIIVVVLILSIALVGGVVVLIRNYVKDGSLFFSESMISEVVAYHGDDKLTAETVVSLGQGESYSITVDGSYSVRIVANDDVKKGFDFIVNDEYCSLKGVGDCTVAFEIQKNESGFTVYAPYSAEAIGRALFPGKNVTVSDEPKISSDSFFLIEITQGDAVLDIKLKLDIMDKSPILYLDKSFIVL